MIVSPEEVRKLRKDYIPSCVFEAFDQLIVKNFDGKSSTVLQDEVMSMIEDQFPSRQYIFDHHYLDVEDAYREKGWKVSYDKPAYCETYPASFKFSV